MDALTIAMLVCLLGWTGLYGLNVNFKPYIKPVVAQSRTIPHGVYYVCDKRFSDAIIAGSKLDPTLFCKKVTVP